MGWDRNQREDLWCYSLALRTLGGSEIRLDCQICLSVRGQPRAAKAYSYFCFCAWESIGYSRVGCFDFSQFQKEIGKGKGRCVESPLEFMKSAGGERGFCCPRFCSTVVSYLNCDSGFGQYRWDPCTQF